MIAPGSVRPGPVPASTPPTGVDIAELPLPAGTEVRPHGIAAGPDGALYVALEVGSLARIPA